MNDVSTRIENEVARIDSIHSQKTGGGGRTASSGNDPNIKQNQGVLTDSTQLQIETVLHFARQLYRLCGLKQVVGRSVLIGRLRKHCLSVEDLEHCPLFQT